MVVCVYWQNLRSSPCLHCKPKMIKKYFYKGSNQSGTSDNSTIRGIGLRGHIEQKVSKLTNASTAELLIMELGLSLSPCKRPCRSQRVQSVLCIIQRLKFGAVRLLKEVNSIQNWQILLMQFSRKDANHVALSDPPSPLVRLNIV